MMVFIRNVSHWLQESLEWRFIQLKDIVKKILIYIAIFSVILWLAIIFYGSFYYMYIPKVSLSKPVHLEFSVCDDGVGMCSFPSANISFLSDEGDEVFARGQSYTFLLNIELPESPVNKDLGMFMVKLQMFDRKGEVTSSVSRSAILHFRSELLRIMDTFVFSPLLLFGFQQQQQLLTVELFANYVNDAYNPAVGAVVTINSRKIQVYSAKLNIHANFSGLRYILFNWPILSAIIGVSTNMIVLFFIVLLSWYRLSCTSDPQDQEDYNTANRIPTLEERRRTVQARMDRERAGVLRNRGLLEETETIGHQDDNSDNSETNLATTREDLSIPECETHIRRRVTAKQQ